MNLVEMLLFAASVRLLDKHPVEIPYETREQIAACKVISRGMKMFGFYHRPGLLQHPLWSEVYKARSYVIRFAHERRTST